MLTSAANPRVKHAIRVRDGSERGLLLAEGERLVEELAHSELRVTQVFHSDHASDRVLKLTVTFQERGVECIPASGAVMKALSDTVNPQGIAAIAERPEAPDLQSLALGDAPLFVALDAVQDPGNVGTIIRTAEAAGAAALIALQGTADVFSPKVLRSAMGSAFRLPILRQVSPDELVKWTAHAGVRCVAADGGADCTHVEHEWRQPTLLILGNEANGVSSALLKRCDQRVRIPMRAPVESLNVASAAAVLLFEAARQRGY